MAARFRYNPPPNWPRPPYGWTPPHGWTPPIEWGPPPPNWQFWIKTGFWQLKYVLPTAMFAMIVLIFVLIVPWDTGIDESSDSYLMGYDRGEDFGKIFGTLSGDQISEESKGLNCATMMSMNANDGFEIDGRVIPESDVDEDEYKAGCEAGIEDGIANAGNR